MGIQCTFGPLAQLILLLFNYGLTCFPGPLSVASGSTLSLAIIIILVMLWFILENFVFEKYLCYVFTVYPVFIFAFSGLVVKLGKSGTSQNYVLASVNLSLTVILMFISSGLYILRCHCRKKATEKVDIQANDVIE